MHTAARLENVQSELEGFVWKLKQETERSIQLNKYSKRMARINYNRSVSTNAGGYLFIISNHHYLFIIIIVKYSRFRIIDWKLYFCIKQFFFRFQLQNEMRKLYIRDNCHPAKVFAISIVHFVTFVSQTIAIRNLCYMLPISNYCKLY